MSTHLRSNINPTASLVESIYVYTKSEKEKRQINIASEKSRNGCVVSSDFIMLVESEVSTRRQKFKQLIFPCSILKFCSDISYQSLIYFNRFSDQCSLFFFFSYRSMHSSSFRGCVIPPLALFLINLLRFSAQQKIYRNKIIIDVSPRWRA